LASMTFAISCFLLTAPSSVPLSRAATPRDGDGDADRDRDREG
jgi:hypothetical protein